MLLYHVLHCIWVGLFITGKISSFRLIPMNSCVLVDLNYDPFLERFHHFFTLMFFVAYYTGQEILFWLVLGAL